MTDPLKIDFAGVEAAIIQLQESDEKIGWLRGQVDYLDSDIKTAKAAVFLEAEGSVEARKAASEVDFNVCALYVKRADAMTAYGNCAGHRQTLGMLIDLYRTQTSAKKMGIL